MTDGDGREDAYLLIHGGASTGRFWDRLAPLLDGPTLAVDLPGRGSHPADLMTVTVPGGVESIVADVDAVDLTEGGRRPLVVIAHSSGGLFVPGVVATIDGPLRVRRIVLSAASVPPDGGTGLDCMQARHREGFVTFFEEAKRNGQSVATPGLPDDPERLREAYGERLDDETLAFMYDPVRIVPDSFNTYFDPVHWSAVGDVPVSYLRGSLDRPIPASLQDEMIADLRDPEVVRLEVGHIPAVTQPQVMADIIHAR